MRRPSGLEVAGWILIVWGLASLGDSAMVGAAGASGKSAETSRETQGVPWKGGAGITESVAQIMAREAEAARLPRRPPSERREYEAHLTRQENPDAPAVSGWPAVESSQALTPSSPQPIGTANFKAISLLSPPESPWLPPDSMGSVGPTQILAVANGRIKVFDRTGAVGGLNADLDVFFTPVSSTGATDPQARYDRLSGRWFVAGLSLDTPNHILIAVSSDATITGSSSFTFYSFQQDLVGPTPNSDTGGFADYDSLGVDAHALYIGVNVFNSSGTSFLGTTGFVVNKADLLAGTPTVTAFRQLAGPNLANAGPYSPRGVDNDDPASTQGYFIGTDTFNYGRLDIRRVSDPGGTPSISGNLLLTVPSTSNPILVPHLGMANSHRRLDALDDRLFAATIHKNKATGVDSLWTAHNIQVDSSGVAASNGGRDGARWYEIRDLDTTPTLYQSGTLFDSASSSPRFFWIPSVAMSGQGHMALGSSTAGTNFHADVAVAGRLSGDALGSIRTFTAATATSSAYNQQLVDGQRWGDYSATAVDPADDMTLWTFQEYCDATNSWGVQVVQLLAPPPATPASAAPASVCSGSAATVIVTGTSSSGSGFFDPGPDTGGPGYTRIAAAVSGGVTVNSVTFDSPTQVTLDLSAAGATPGAQDVTVTNPDGQTGTGTGILTIAPAPDPPAAANNGPVCAGSTLQLTASTVPGATYQWTGPDGFSSSLQNPSIPSATAAATGTYEVTVTVGGCVSTPASTVASVSGEGGICNDGNPCTAGETCQSGSCQGGVPPDLDLDTHVDALCGGDDCDDGDSMVWNSPSEVTNLLLTGASPADPAWDSQAASAGPETVYDLVSGTLTDVTGLDFSAAACLQAGGGNSFSDLRPDPLQGEGVWYLARGRNTCGTGTFGPAPRDSTIPACP